jgi:hypothetical protein
MNFNKKSIFGLAALLIFGIAAVAFAHGGWGDGGYMMGPGYGGHMMGPGYGGGHMMGPGYGGHMMGWDSDDGPYHRGYCDRGNLSDEDAAKLDAAQEHFVNDTRELRRSIDEKQLALESELSKTNPDKTKALDLQQQLSRLRDDFDQKALAHRIEVQKIVPNGYAARGYGNGYCW